MDGSNDDQIKPQGFDEKYYETIDDEEIASDIDDDHSVDEEGEDDEAVGGNRRGKGSEIEIMEDLEDGELEAPDDEDFEDDEDNTSADDRDFDEQLPAGWEPVEQMPEPTTLKGESIMFRWGKDGWRKGVVKKSVPKQLTREERAKGMTHVVS